MTLENLLSQMGIGTKQLTDRYSDYGAPVHDQHVYYAYEHPSHGHGGTSKHGYGGSHKGKAAMSALTLLAFLFFLHILQQCVKDHINDMSNAPVMVMTAGRIGDENISKAAATNKIDKAGVQDPEAKDRENSNAVIESEYAHSGLEEQSSTDKLTRINVAEHVPITDTQKYKYVFKTNENRSSEFPEFVSAMDDDY